MSTDNNNNLQSFKLEAKGRGSILQEARRFISMRSPEKEMKIQAANECICKRKLMGILCRSCGGVFRGRVRQ
ncbi:Hypothetical predicted protein [Mytilus galloprovincialis]|uniref:Uncharacterized protein n=2 Tax=Mytilus TaxID=6548 RepID=A0A8B6H480_MYTGA|nr:Hypothetical predicted protein [Mytilus galloprovincialis]